MKIRDGPPAGVAVYSLPENNNIMNTNILRKKNTLLKMSFLGSKICDLFLNIMHFHSAGLN